MVPGLHSQYRSANASISLSIFCASPWIRQVNRYVELRKHLELRTVLRNTLNVEQLHFKILRNSHTETCAMRNLVL